MNTEQVDIEGLFKKLKETPGYREQVYEAVGLLHQTIELVNNLELLGCAVTLDVKVVYEEMTFAYRYGEGDGDERRTPDQ